MLAKTRLVIGTLGLVTGLISVWFVDISITAIMNGMVLSNGFLNVDPAKVYHYGIYTYVLSLYCCVISAIDGNTK